VSRASSVLNEAQKIVSNLSVEGGTLHPEVQAEHDRVVADLAKEFPQVAKAVKWTYERRNYPHFDQYARNESRGGKITGEIKIPVFGKDQPLARVDREQDMANKKGVMVPGGLRSILAHEFGHAVNHHIIRHGDDALKDEWFDKKREIADDFAVSEYGKSAINEGVAERFAAEFMGQAPRKLIPIMHSYLERATEK